MNINAIILKKLVQAIQLDLLPMAYYWLIIITHLASIKLE